MKYLLNKNNYLQFKINENYKPFDIYLNHRN